MRSDSTWSSSRRRVARARAGSTSRPGPSRARRPAPDGWRRRPRAAARRAADQQALRAGVCPGVWTRRSWASRSGRRPAARPPERPERGHAAVERHPGLLGPGREGVPVGRWTRCRAAGTAAGAARRPRRGSTDVVEVQVGEDDQVDLLPARPRRRPARPAAVPASRSSPTPARPGRRRRCRPARPGRGPGPRSTSRAAASGQGPRTPRDGATARGAQAARRDLGEGLGQGVWKSPVTSQWAVTWTVPTVSVPRCHGASFNARGGRSAGRR